MVAELLARSPTAFLGISPLANTMAQSSAAPGEEYVRAAMADYQVEEIDIGGVMVKIGLAAAGGIVGASALSEAKYAAKEVVVEKFTQMFGKYQKEHDAITTNEDLSDIQENDLDGTPDRPRPIDDDQTDPAIASVTDKVTKFEALAANSIKAKTDVTKKVSTEGMLALQEEKYTKFIAELFEQQQMN